MKYRLMAHVGLALVTCANAMEYMPPPPQVQEFAQERYRQHQIRDDGLLREYFLTHAVLTHSRQWVVFIVASNYDNPNVGVPVAVGAYHIPSGRTRQLVFPSLARPTTSLASLRLVPLGDDTCGVSINLPQHASKDTNTPRVRSAKDDDTELRWRQFLWEWRLPTDTVRFVGPWNVVMSSVFEVVPLGQCGLCTTVSSENPPTVALRDLASGKVAKTSFEVGRQISHIYGLTMASMDDRCSFAVCNSWSADKGELSLYCVDPNAPEGIRWRVSQRQVEKALDQKISGAAFLQQPIAAGGRLPVFARNTSQSDDRDEYASYLLLLEPRTGKIDQQHVLPFNVSFPDLPILSPDEKRLVLYDCALRFQGRTPVTNEEVTDAEFLLYFRVVDLTSGRWQDSVNYFDQLRFCRMLAFLDDRRLMLIDKHALWVFDTTTLHLNELFPVAPPLDFSETEETTE